MTPCFLHTPNMTNKWNDFKPAAATTNTSKNDSELPLFIRSGHTPVVEGGQQQLTIIGDTGEILKAQQKKPMTSHQSTKVGEKKQPEVIKLNPQDIYLLQNQQSQTGVQSTAKGSRNSLSQKPSTSGGSFRRPLSRNHPMLNLVSQKGKEPAINVLQHLQL